MNGTITYPPGEVLTAAGSDVDKSGPQTSEFWMLVIHYVLTIATSAMAFLHPGYHLSMAAQGLVDAVVPPLALIAAAIASYGYSRSRAHTKAAAAALRAEKYGVDSNVQTQRETLSYEEERQQRAWDIAALAQANAMPMSGKA